MKSSFSKILSVMTLGLSLQLTPMSAQADDIRLGVPGYGGNGCPAGTASATLSPDQKSLSLIFDQYIVEAGGVNPRTARKSCNIAIPVHVPQGLSISIIAVDYRGFNALPGGARSMFNAEYFFAGSMGPRVSRTFSGPLTSNYIIHNDLLLSAVTWSPCGQDVNLRVNTSMMAMTSSSLADALATVDSADFRAGIIYRLQWRRC